MSDCAIKIADVSKFYRVYNTPKDVLLEILMGRNRHKDFSALHEISLSIGKGSVVGVIGRNGAGKSTLLRIIAGTLEPSIGRVEVHGRVSAILELGTGFNPNYTGRENIYLGGLCLGLSRREIEEKENDIIEFSELGEFIDQPFRTYSSGMQARLTFSVAIAPNPEILIVDEALSVGDVRFQRKCFRRFEEFKAAGCTILFVTHQTGTVEAICDRAVYLADGRVVADGSPREVVGCYMKDLFGAKDSAADYVAGAPPARNGREVRYGTGEAKILDCGILDEGGQPVNVVFSGDRYATFCDVRCETEQIDDLNVGISFTTTEGIRLVAANPLLHRTPIPTLHRGDVVRVTLEVEMNLGLGDYFLTFGAWGTFADRNYDRRVDALHITVRGDSCLSQSLVNMKPHYSSTLLGANPDG